MWLKNAWDNVSSMTIQKRLARCGFTNDVFTDQEDDTAIDSSHSAFVEASGTSWEMYANFDQDLATNMTTDEDWEAALLEKARAGTSADGSADTINDEDNEEEEEEVVTEKPTLSSVAAISYLGFLIKEENNCWTKIASGTYAEGCQFRKPVQKSYYIE